MYFLSVPKENNPEKVAKKNIDQELQRLMDVYGNDVLRTSYMYLKDMQKAEDAFQEVFIKIYNKFDSFKGESSEKTWIIKVTINVCKDMLRNSWIKRVLLTDRIKTSGRTSDIEGRIIKRDENKALFDEVLSLPAALKEVIILYYYHAYDTAEISKILNVAEGTVRSRLHRARTMLKGKLEGRIDLGD
ncbi:sigma-70 family RNA polymerase sigma factor [Pseudoclostridium thermosuccinogenes]|jgi:RNA polymerase sigma-70 factor (ECF subfamily)|uniref:sigma-70 family RNA polymerase sigma factor n=1 Tax=Clostridium thermosuccinogenes TaxID=84032 RepID=UPI001863A094|nr:sigma-70 family RNA polymerase sigma factor [Pseudoclostridium thermosuccinogenes]